MLMIIVNHDNVDDHADDAAVEDDYDEDKEKRR